jgi:hypothetical protein
MEQVFWILAGISAVAAVALAVLGFIVFPAQVKKQGKPTAKSKKTTTALERRGMARALFMIAVASAFVCSFFAIFLP